MTNFLTVKEDPALVRDTGSKAILQTDTRRKDEHKARKRALKLSLEKNKYLEDKVQELEQRIKRLEEISQINQEN